MTHLFRTPRFLMLAASTAVAVGGVLTPTGAFAVTPAAPLAAVAHDRVMAPDDQGDTDGKGNHRLIGRAQESLFGSDQGKDDSPDKFHTIGRGGPLLGSGKDRGDADTGTGILIDPPRRHTWACIAAPCDDPMAKPDPGGLPVPDGIPVPHVPVPHVPVPDGVVTIGDLTAPKR
ncbi:hypothetical protein PV721_09395 [Streptomyces sp. MB09-01]|uniref:hypothetical protein n=1 Tax=Streptomyces sp. MB09-01 TaxID=3028666 RepID=UPI0029ADAB15|nr:hypothetical protein [Streptomyces sp. MB09-01]MDX3534580.1 hypothetical protein [Streptomyces sp. MB09-01]